MAKHLPFFLLSLFLLLLSFCIQLVLADKPPSLSCKENQFACLDGRKCVEYWDLCDSDTDCEDDSDDSPCLHIEFDTLTIWVPILEAVGPFLVPISSETGFLFTGP